MDPSNVFQDYADLLARCDSLTALSDNLRIGVDALKEERAHLLDINRQANDERKRLAVLNAQLIEVAKAAKECVVGHCSLIEVEMALAALPAGTLE